MINGKFVNTVYFDQGGLGQIDCSEPKSRVDLCLVIPIGNK